MRISKLILLTLMIFSLFSCELEKEIDTHIGKWIMTQEVYHSYVDGELEESFTVNYDPSSDDYFSATIVELTDSKLNIYSNDSGIDYDIVEMDYTIEDSSLVTIQEYEEGGHTITEEETLEYEIVDDTFTLYMLWEEDDYRETIVLTMEAYNGPMPPTSWVTPLSSDSYEDDDDMASARFVTTALAHEIHTINQGDIDWFKFDANLNTNYMIKVSSVMDNVLYLYDSDGNNLFIDDDNDYGLDIDNVESVIVWKCSTVGTYYFAVCGYDYSSDPDNHAEGYYDISLSLTTMNPPAKKLNKKTKRSKNYPFLK
ncbi:MAG: hypothetical protein KAI81_07155 [Candidatus Marinimicrobia bacterium]|nr:hypothetical protein [Candidatus Neomarinimicrobiota bacterium]